MNFFNPKELEPKKIAKNEAEEPFHIPNIY
jgi:hypothetical protein